MANIKLSNVQFTDVKLKSTEYSATATNELNNPNLTLGFMTSDSDTKVFAVKFNIILKNESFELSVESVAHFESSEDIAPDFNNSDFAKINAPAIAFPYIRAYISNLTLSSGFNPVFLPTVNFVAMAEAKKNNEANAEIN